MKLPITLLALSLLLSFNLNGAPPSNSTNDLNSMNENESYVSGTIRMWVWSGFYLLDDIKVMMQDIIEPDVNEAKMALFAEAEFEKKSAAEASWPKATDFNRLESAFSEMWGVGVIALHNAGYTMSDGFSDVSDVLSQTRKPMRGFCFYHFQDVEGAIEAGDLYLAFGSIEQSESESISIGKVISGILTKHGFDVEWNETSENRIRIVQMKWQNRGA